MLSLEGENEKRCVRKYLSVTDFKSDEKHGEDRGDSGERRHYKEEERSPVEDSGNWEDREEGKKSEEQRPTTCLDPLWEGLGSLGKRLAGVNARFDQLDQEIDHDREVSVYLDACYRQPWSTSSLGMMFRRPLRRYLKRDDVVILRRIRLRRIRKYLTDLANQACFRDSAFSGLCFFVVEHMCR